MMKQRYSSPTFQPCQIVCLEHELVRLYAEVVQTAEAKPVCWVRPIVLVEEAKSERSHSFQLLGQVYDLREDSDLLLPAPLFRVAIDLEVLPLLSRLDRTEGDDSLHQERHLRLKHFVEQICLAHPELFCKEQDGSRTGN